MNDDNSPIDANVKAELQSLGITYRAIECSPELADTAAFCKHYGYLNEQSANALLIASTRGEPLYAMCIVLAHCRLDTNKTARKKLGVRRLSFAPAELTANVTGMQLGGVTPIGLPDNIPVWIDSRVMLCEQIILGGGNRMSKIIMPPDELQKIPNSEVVENLAIVKQISE